MFILNHQAKHHPLQNAFQGLGLVPSLGFHTSLLGSDHVQIKSLEEALQITCVAVQLFSTVPISVTSELTHVFAAVGLSLSNSLISLSSDIEQVF